MRLKIKKNKILLAICTYCFVLSVNAASITYEATDLTDNVIGEDLWRYTYTVSDHIFDVDNGFSIFFDYIDYANLEDPAPAVNSDWDILVLQPDSFLPDDGIYDALALLNAPSLLDAFTLDFVWLGAGTPGSQPFEVYDDSFNIISSGNTISNVSNVPEPATIFLFSVGLLSFWGNKKRFKINQAQNLC